jgi:hypothetical protein
MTLSISKVTLALVIALTKLNSQKDVIIQVIAGSHKTVHANAQISTLIDQLASVQAPKRGGLTTNALVNVKLRQFAISQFKQLIWIIVSAIALLNHQPPDVKPITHGVVVNVSAFSAPLVEVLTPPM